MQVNVLLPPGTSLDASNRVGGNGRSSGLPCRMPGKIVAFGRRTGRAELDEHAEGVNVSEIIVTLDPESDRSSRERFWPRFARS